MFGVSQMGYTPNNIKTNQSSGVTALVKSINQEAQQFTDRDLLSELENTANNQPIDRKSPTVAFLNGLEDHLKLVNSHIVPVNRIGQQYVKLLRNQKVLERTEEKIDNINSNKDVADQTIQKADKNGTQGLPKKNQDLLPQSLPIYPQFAPVINPYQHQPTIQNYNGDLYKMIPFEISR